MMTLAQWFEEKGIEKGIQQGRQEVRSGIRPASSE